jgi:hypothetical protein
MLSSEVVEGEGSVEGILSNGHGLDYVLLLIKEDGGMHCVQGSISLTSASTSILETDIILLHRTYHALLYSASAKAALVHLQLNVSYQQAMRLALRESDNKRRTGNVVVVVSFFQREAIVTPRHKHQIIASATSRHKHAIPVLQATSSLTIY